MAALAKDVNYLSDFVDTLDNAPILKENLDELQQTVLLMQTENPDDFYDVSIRNKKFGRVDALNGPRILEKYVFTTPVPGQTNRQQDHTFIDRKSIKNRPACKLFLQVWDEVDTRLYTSNSPHMRTALTVGV